MLMESETGRHLDLLTGNGSPDSEPPAEPFFRFPLMIEHNVGIRHDRFSSGQVRVAGHADSHGGIAPSERNFEVWKNDVRCLGRLVDVCYHFLSPLLGFLA